MNNNNTEPTLKNPKKKKQKNAKKPSQDHSKPTTTKPSRSHGERKFDPLWKHLEPRHSMYLSGEVERELTKQDFSDLENKYKAKITLLQNNDPGEPFKKNVISCFEFPNDEKMREFKASEDAKQLQVPSSKTLVPGMLMNTMRGSKHNITVHCSKCKKIVCEATSIYRVYKDCIWTKKGSPVIMDVSPEKYMNKAKDCECSDASCSQCGKFLGYRCYDLPDPAEYKILVLTKRNQQAKIQGDQSKHTPLNCAELQKTNVEQKTSQNNFMVPITHPIPIPVTTRMDAMNRNLPELRRLFTKYSGIKIKESATATIQDFSVWLWQLGVFDSDVMEKWELFQVYAREDFQNNTTLIKKAFHQQCEKLKAEILKHMNEKYTSTINDEIRSIIHNNIGCDTSNTSDLDPYNFNQNNDELYITSNNGHVFLSVDLKHANYTATYFLDPAIVNYSKTFEEYIASHNLSKLFEFRYFRQVLFGKVEQGFITGKPISEAQSAILDAVYHLICSMSLDFESTGLQRCEKSFKFSKDELMFDLGTADMNAEEAEHLIRMILESIADRMPNLQNKLHVTVFQLNNEQVDVPTPDGQRSVSFYVRKDVVNEKNQSFKTVMKEFLVPVCSQYTAKHKKILLSSPR